MAGASWTVTIGPGGARPARGAERGATSSGRPAPRRRRRRSVRRHSRRAVGAGEVQRRGREPLAGQQAAAEHLREDGARPASDDLGAGLARPRRFDQAVAAGEDVGPQPSASPCAAAPRRTAPGRSGGSTAGGTGPRRRRASRRRPSHSSQSSAWRSRLDEREAGQLDADRRRDRALVRAALGRQRDARRRAGHDEASAVVEAVDQRVEATADERVVDGADGQQLLAVQLVAQAELRAASGTGSSR